MGEPARCGSLEPDHRAAPGMAGRRAGGRVGARATAGFRAARAGPRLLQPRRRLGGTGAPATRRRATASGARCGRLARGGAGAAAGRGTHLSSAGRWSAPVVSSRPAGRGRRARLEPAACRPALAGRQGRRHLGGRSGATPRRPRHEALLGQTRFVQALDRDPATGGRLWRRRGGGRSIEPNEPAAGERLVGGIGEAQRRPPVGEGDRHGFSLEHR